MTTKFLLSATGLLLLAACGSGDRDTTRATIEKDGVKTTIEVSNAWCRATPNGARTGACYFTVKSSGAERLTGVATPAAAVAQLHSMAMAAGRMTMAEIPDGLALPAGKAVELKPGAAHLMLIGLTGPLIEGQSVELTLGFHDAPAMQVLAPVRLPGAEGETKRE
jgi:copper(I)-binding protein